MRKRMLICGSCGHEAQEHQFKRKKYASIIHCPECDADVKLGFELLNKSKALWQKFTLLSCKEKVAI